LAIPQSSAVALETRSELGDREYQSRKHAVKLSGGTLPGVRRTPRTRAFDPEGSAFFVMAE